MILFSKPEDLTSNYLKMSVPNRCISFPWSQIFISYHLLSKISSLLIFIMIVFLSAKIRCNINFKWPFFWVSRAQKLSVEFPNSLVFLFSKHFFKLFPSHRLLFTSFPSPLPSETAGGKSDANISPWCVVSQIAPTGPLNRALRSMAWAQFRVIAFSKSPFEPIKGLGFESGRAGGGWEMVCNNHSDFYGNKSISRGAGTNAIEIRIRRRMKNYTAAVCEQQFVECCFRGWIW